MRLSEKIGYALEHVLSGLLEVKGVPVSRSERPNDESIKSDISFRWKKRDYIVFVTHTRTTGMTNRKFYRTFEELAQRRLSNPKAICIEVSLIGDTTHVRNQYGLVFQSLFDASLSVLTKNQQQQFVDFVESMSSPITYEDTQAQAQNLSRPILQRFGECVDSILSTKPSAPAEVRNYWTKEAEVSVGSDSVDHNDTRSVKRGMRLLSLLSRLPIKMADVAQGSATRPAETDDSDIDHLSRLGVCSAVKSIRGPRLIFPEDVREAARLCASVGVGLSRDSFVGHLATSGAINLFDALLIPGRLHADYKDAIRRFEGCTSKSLLVDAFQRDFQSDALRCDFIALAIRSCGCSQNEIALDLRPRLIALKEGNPPCDMVVRFVISKNTGLDNLIHNSGNALTALADAVWERLRHERSVPDWDDYFNERLSNFLTHPYVQIEMSVIDELLSDAQDLGKRRASILPQICGLPTKYRMGVEATYNVAVGQKRVFIKTVSTPEERHHKHKEFSGKLRAIRYSLDGTGKLIVDGTKFVLVVDGNWSPSQIAMLRNAGWLVFGWSSFLQWLPTEAARGGNT